MLSPPRYCAEVIHFANINKAQPVWWLDIPLKKLDKHDFLVFALCNKKQQLEVLGTPTSFLQENLHRLSVRKDRGVISLELSCQPQNLFECVRPRNCGISFAQFQRDTLEMPNANI